MLRVVLFFSPNFCMMFVNPLKWFNDLVFVIHELSYSNFFRTHRKKRELSSLKTGYWENCLVDLHKPSESCFEAQIAFSFPEERMMAWPPNIYLLNQGWNKIPSKRQELNFLSRVKWTMLGTRKTSFLPKLIMNAVHWYHNFKLYQIFQVFRIGHWY